jgi:hypothetical protein
MTYTPLTNFSQSLPCNIHSSTELKQRVSRNSVNIILNCLNVNGQVFNMYKRPIIHSYTALYNSLLTYCKLYYWSGKIMPMPQIYCMNLRVFSKISMFSVINSISANIQTPIYHLLFTTIYGGTLRTIVHQNIA